MKKRTDSKLKTEQQRMSEAWHLHLARNYAPGFGRDKQSAFYAGYRAAMRRVQRRPSHSLAQQKEP